MSVLFWKVTCNKNTFELCVPDNGIHPVSKPATMADVGDKVIISERKVSMRRSMSKLHSGTYMNLYNRRINSYGKTTSWKESRRRKQWDR